LQIKAHADKGNKGQQKTAGADKAMSGEANSLATGDIYQSQQGSGGENKAHVGVNAIGIFIGHRRGCAQGIYVPWKDGGAVIHCHVVVQKTVSHGKYAQKNRRHSGSAEKESQSGCKKIEQNKIGSNTSGGDVPWRTYVELQEEEAGCRSENDYEPVNIRLDFTGKQSEKWQNQREQGYFMHIESIAILLIDSGGDDSLYAKKLC
jgi:hypothetical protein